jgi:MerR family redox-sensitive transcriptional activator SoxR
MNIGKVSKQLSIPASTIRYYESEGLIARLPRVSGRRTFNQKSVFTLRFIQLAQKAGFSIEEIKSLVESYDDASKPSSMWGSLATAKRTNIQKEIKELQQMDAILESLLTCDCPTVNECVRRAFEQDEL